MRFGFFDDDPICQVREMWGAWMLLNGTLADRYRYNYQDEVCQECGEDVEDVFSNGGEIVVDDELGLPWTKCYCYDCWSEGCDDWFIPLFHGDDQAYMCDYCADDAAWFAEDEDGYTACSACWSGWASEWSHDEEDEGVWCAWCETEVDEGVDAYVTDPNGDTYCMECWCWEDNGTPEPPAKVARARHDEDAKGKARNDRDKAALRARYKDHCAYHLFHAHHRKHQGCTFAAAGQNCCSRGSHGIPDDFEDAQGELETPARA